VFCNLLLSGQFSTGFLPPWFGASSVLQMETAPICMISASVLSKGSWATSLGVGRGSAHGRKNERVARRYAGHRVNGILGGVLD